MDINQLMQMLGPMLQQRMQGMGSAGGDQRMYAGGNPNFSEMGGGFRSAPMPPRYLGPPASEGSSAMPRSNVLPPTYLGPPQSAPQPPRYLGPPSSGGPDMNIGGPLTPPPSSGVAYPQGQSLAQVARPRLGLRSF